LPPTPGTKVGRSDATIARIWHARAPISVESDFAWAAPERARQFLNAALAPDEDDEVTGLIVDSHDGGFHDGLFSDRTGA